ncbi:MAG TPA: peptidase E [Solirubrobacteraceae bacterium]|nr:peptidase E [Solirubrobacteraceae bacterium]
MTRTIFAMGGGGFTADPTNTALDEYILSLTNKREPRILFLPTASGDPNAQIAAFRSTFGNRECHARHLSLFRLEDEPVDIRTLILGQDVVYVGGGSMRNLLAIWREHGLDRILRDAWDEGVVLAGLSAGGMCWFQHGITRSTGRPAPARGLGFLPGSFSVHYDGDPTRRPVFLDAVARGSMPDGYGADDGVGLLFSDRTLTRIVSARPEARAYRVAAGADAAVDETVIEPELLNPATLGTGRDVPADIREYRAARYGRTTRR